MPRPQQEVTTINAYLLSTLHQDGRPFQKQIQLASRWRKISICEYRGLIQPLKSVDQRRVCFWSINMRDAAEVESAVAAFASSGNSGLVVTGSSLAQFHRDLIVALAARHRLPTVYYSRYFVTGGGLISYGPDFVDQFRRAAAYVDRILKGENPADLPVQVPTKYETVINRKTAKALGLTLPPALLARADEMIE